VTDSGTGFTSKYVSPFEYSASHALDTRNNTCNSFLSDFSHSWNVVTSSINPSPARCDIWKCVHWLVNYCTLAGRQPCQANRRVFAAFCVECTRSVTIGEVLLFFRQIAFLFAKSKICGRKYEFLRRKGIFILLILSMRVANRSSPYCLTLKMKALRQEIFTSLHGVTPYWKRLQQRRESAFRWSSVFIRFYLCMPQTAF
jgi:hypothetical protein